MTTAITATRTIYADCLTLAARDELRVASVLWPESDGRPACGDSALESGLRFAGQHNVLDALTSGATTLGAAHAAYVALKTALAGLRCYEPVTFAPTSAARDAVWSVVKSHGACAVEVGLRLVPGKLDTGETLDLLGDCGVKHPSERR